MGHIDYFHKNSISFLLLLLALFTPQVVVKGQQSNFGSSDPNKSSACYCHCAPAITLSCPALPPSASQSASTPDTTTSWTGWYSTTPTPNGTFNTTGWTTFWPGSSQWNNWTSTTTEWPVVTPSPAACLNGIYYLQFPSLL